MILVADKKHIHTLKTTTLKEYMLHDSQFQNLPVVMYMAGLSLKEPIMVTHFYTF